MSAHNRASSDSLGAGGPFVKFRRSRPPVGKRALEPGPYRSLAGCVKARSDSQERRCGCRKPIPRRSDAISRGATDIAWRGRELIVAHGVRAENPDAGLACSFMRSGHGGSCLLHNHRAVLRAAATR